jgi:hypothetical protein
MRSADAVLEAIKTSSLALREKFLGLRDRVQAAEKAGLSRNYAIGLLLRRQQVALAGPGDFRERARRQGTAISEAQMAQFAVVDARRHLEPVEDTATVLLASLPVDTDPIRMGVLAQEARTLLGTQRELLTGLVQDYDTHLAQLLRSQLARGGGQGGR